jgi:hypothetical protein
VPLAALPEKSDAVVEPVVSVNLYAKSAFDAAASNPTWPVQVLDAAVPAVSDVFEGQDQEDGDGLAVAQAVQVHAARTVSTRPTTRQQSSGMRHRAMRAAQPMGSRSMFDVSW